MKKTTVPLWVVLGLLSVLPPLIVGVFNITTLFFGSQNQMNRLYDEMVVDIHNGIYNTITQYFDSMKVVAKGVVELEPLFKNYSMPEDGSYDPSTLIRYMSMLKDDFRFESVGMMIPFNSSETSKLSWQIAHGFGCPEFIYAYSDASIYPTFLGHCTFTNGTISKNLDYQGVDWGLKPDEIELMKGTKSETFLPVFALLNVMTLTFSSAYRYESDITKVYGLTFAEKSLTTINHYFEDLQLGNNGVAFIFERNNGAMLTASVLGQTTVEDPTNTYGGVRRLRVDEAPNTIISKAGKSILEYYGSFENIPIYDNIVADDLLIGVNSYKTQGIDWIITIVVPESEIFSEIRYYSVLALVSTIIFLVLVIFTSGTISLLISRHVEKIRKQISQPNASEECQPLFSETRISELHNLQEELSSRETAMNSHFIQSPRDSISPSS